MFLSLLVPFVYVNFNVTDTSKYENTFKEIGKFRSYYEKLIAMTDPEYLNSINNKNNLVFEGTGQDNYSKNFVKKNNTITNGNTTEYDSEQQLNQNKKITIAQVLFLIYIVGVIIFLSRILILFRWVYKTISNNKIEIRDKVKLVIINENLPPFSFLNYVFLNKKLSNSKSKEILEHEKVHIVQSHSTDLLLAHFISIFQWFNPFAWLLQKAIKTNHEYIADSEVVNNGYDLLDYQELLLNQFISIPSVQLVNNFNLISIKKRIAMMNKIKSGLIAKLKALLIIPAALVTFILFANLTLNGPGKALKNFSFVKYQNNIDQLKGIWENKSKNKYGHLIKFSNDKFSVLEDNSMIKEYQYKITNNNIIINIPNSEPVALKFQVTNNKIKIWWNDSNSSEFTKTNFQNSLDIFLANKGLNIKPPVVKNYKELQRASLTLFVGIQDNKIVVQDKVGEFSDLEKMISEAKSTFNQLDLDIVTVAIAVDKNAPMKQIYVLNQILRKLNLLKVGFVCYPDDNPDNLHALTTFIRKLPPMDAEILDTKDLPGMGIEYFEIDAVNQENTPQKLKPQIKKLVSESEKYIMCLVFNNSTTYKSYTEYNDMVWSVIYGFRNQYAMEKYNSEYENLGRELQNEVKKKYPIILTQVNIDEDEYNYEAIK